MADSTIYKGQSLTIQTVNEPFVDGSLSVGGDLSIDSVQSANRLSPDLATVVGKRPFIRATLLDPSALTDPLATTSAVVAVFRAFEQNGGPGATYKSVTGAQGLLVPVRLNFAARSRATLDVIFLAAFATGTGLAHGTTNTASAAAAKSFYPTSLVIGGDTITDIQSGSINYDVAVKDDVATLEPTFYYYDRYSRSGEIVTKNLAMVTAARLEDGVTSATTTLTLTNRESGGGTIVITLGSCFVKAEIQGDEARISFNEVG